MIGAHEDDSSKRGGEDGALVGSDRHALKEVLEGGG